MKGGELRRFGYPLTESLEEQSSADGKKYIVQYFERAVMEYHPGEKAPYDVQLIPLGSARLAQLYPRGAPYNASAAVPSPTPDYAATQVAQEQHATAVAQVTATSQAKAAGTAQAKEVKSQRATATAVARSYNATIAAVAKRDNATATAIAAEFSSPGTGQFIPYPGNGGGPTRCRDGTYSHSSGRGTCSHHGGIAP